MAILLDQTTKAEYNALSLASARASAVVSALSGTVVVEVYNGTDTLMASGTMAAPWATASGATITVGEVTGVGLLVTTGGAPDANWYCQFRSGSRFVRGTFGVLGSGRDFVWSLASFQTGSRGTLGTVVMTATGDAEGGPVLLTAPTISTFFAATATGGELLAATPGVYEYDDGVRFTGTIGATDLQSRPDAYTAVFYIGSNPSVSSTTDEYKNWRLVADFLYGQPPYVADGMAVPPKHLSCGIRSYNGATKCVTVEWDNSWIPVIGGTWKLVKDYPILRKGQWKRNGSPISGEFTRAYQIKPADIGQSITYEETAGFVDWRFVQDGETPAAPPTPTISLTTTSSAYVSSSSFSSSARVTSAADFSYIGSFISPVGTTTTKISVVPASQSYNGQVSLLLSDYNRSDEIEIPTLSTNPNPALLNPGVVRRTSSDIFNGWMTQAKNGFGDQWIAGTAALSGSSNIVASTVAYYNPISKENIFIKRPADISSATSNNPFCVRATNQPNGRWASGAITAIPAALQSALGGDLMAASGAIAVAGNNSQGPGGMVFSSADIDAASAKFETGTVLGGSNTTALLAATASSTPNYYVNWVVAFIVSGTPYSTTVTAYNNSTKQITFANINGSIPTVTAGSTYSLIAPVYAKQVYGKDSPLEPDNKKFPTIWNNVNAFNNGAFIPRGTTSVINTTNAMIGKAQYGLWATFDDPYGQNWGGIDLTQKERLLAQAVYGDYSPAPIDGSVWANTFMHTCLFWVYDTSDLAAVVGGSKTYDEIKPNALFSFPLPYAGESSKSVAAFDNTNNRLYIFERLASITNSGLRNLVHVYSCNKYV